MEGNPHHQIRDHLYVYVIRATRSEGGPQLEYYHNKLVTNIFSRNQLEDWN